MLELEIGVKESAEFLSNLPASAQWMAALHGRIQSHRRIKGYVEWEYLNRNITEFQGLSVSDEADNYSSIRFSDFAESWNKWIDSLKYSEPEVTHKTASYLQDAYKPSRRKAVQSTTI